MSRHVRGGAAVAIVSVLFSCGCGGASTQYEPKQPDRAYLVLEGGAFAFHKNGRTHPLDTVGAEALVSCNARAERLMEESRGHVSSAATLFAVGVAFGLVGTLFTAPAAVSHEKTARAQWIDALNIHNDDELCVMSAAAKGETK